MYFHHNFVPLSRFSNFQCLFVQEFLTNFETFFFLVRLAKVFIHHVSLLKGFQTFIQMNPYSYIKQNFGILCCTNYHKILMLLIIYLIDSGRNGQKCEMKTISYGF